MVGKNSFIFDLDGVLVDTQTKFHARAESIVLKKYGILFEPEEITERFAGVSTKRVFEQLAPEHDYKLLLSRKWEIIHNFMRKGAMVQSPPGMYELVSLLSERGVNIAVASAAPMNWVKKCLKEARPFEHPVKRMYSMFTHKRIFSAEDCENPKPAPDVFFIAHASFGLEKSLEDSKETIYVVGDGRSDVIAGLAAGFNVLYLSEKNKEFDNVECVKRFASSLELADYIIKNLI